MDYIREFDIRIDREMYYAGEVLTGHVVLNTTENFKLKSKWSMDSFHWYSGTHENLSTRRVEIGTKTPTFFPHHLAC